MVLGSSVTFACNGIGGISAGTLQTTPSNLFFLNFVTDDKTATTGLGYEVNWYNCPRCNNDPSDPSDCTPCSCKKKKSAVGHAFLYTGTEVKPLCCKKTLSYTWC